MKYFVTIRSLPTQKKESVLVVFIFPLKTIDILHSYATCNVMTISGQSKCCYRTFC